MDNIILNFLEAYKNLDEICKQIFFSDIGISKYIEEMENESQGSFYVSNWENDYKKLKHMRWIRNQLVHDTDSFQQNMVTMDDIDWLKHFRSRIMNCTDPFALLNQSRKQNNKVRKVHKNNKVEKIHRNSSVVYYDMDNSGENKKNSSMHLFVVIVFVIILLIAFCGIAKYVLSL